MSAEDKLDNTMMIDLIEGELEERKVSFDRRQKDSKDRMKEVTETERREAEDRRTLKA